MNKKLTKFLSFLYIAAVIIPAALSITTVYEVQAQGELTTVTIQPDDTTGHDAQMLSSASGTNYGSLTTFAIGESNAASSVARSLIKFDLSGLPYDMNVVTATLDIVVDQDLSSNGRTLYAYAVNINQPWIESWVSWQGYSGTNWQVAGASGANDVWSTPIGSVAVTSSMTDGQVVSIPIDGKDIEAMRRDDFVGIKLQMDVESDDQYIFRSSEHATVADHPKLVLEYEAFAHVQDPGWVCVDLEHTPDCPSYAPMSPFFGSGVISTLSQGGGQTIEEALMLCYPYPKCVNDYPVYYRIVYDFTWTSSTSSAYGSRPTFHFVIPGKSSKTILSPYECGSGTLGHCEGVVEGQIAVSELPVNTAATQTVVLRYGTDTQGSVLTKVLEYSFYLSIVPFDQNCADTWFVPMPETFEFDSILETPLGISGTPADNQLQPTVIGETYMVRVNGGPWDDGTDDRTDASVSLDGTTWMTWAEFSVNAICIDVAAETLGNDDYRILYFVATTEEFYIRVNDTAGNFADNTNLVEPPYSFTIGQAFGVEEQACESQFTYDSGEVFASIALLNSSDEDGARAANALTQYDIFQAGEWYAVEVVDGTWQDNGGAPSIAMQYVFTGATASGGDWEDLAEGSDLVQCVHTDGDVVFIQAIDTTLNLRVDDGDSNFSNNTGSLEVNIYHTLRERPTETCEMQFTLDDLVRSDSVDGDQSNGKVFALAVGTGLNNSNETEEFFLSGGLVPGAWYALETTGGPWGYLANFHYDMAVAEETAGDIGTTPSGEWGPLAEWDMAECNVETDKLGHRMVYFQIPIVISNQWKLRVNGSTAWQLNGGGMSWNLYRVRDLGSTPDGICDYTYTEEGKITPAPQTVNATATNGDTLSLAADTFYAIELLGADYSWYEESGGAPYTDMEISFNNGQTWGDVPDTGVLCSYEDGENLIFFIHTSASPQVKLRVNSTTFENNTGQMGWNIYTADAGTSVTGCTTEGYSVTSFGPVEWIPVQDTEGRMITSTSASYAEIGGLVPGNTYVIETSRGGWTDGETYAQVFEGGVWVDGDTLAERYDAEVSSDGGVTWQSMDGTNSDVNCWEAVGLDYRKIEILVVDGQQWKIRVADTDTATFLDNGGNLAYTLKGLVVPDDEIVQGQFNLMGCNTPALAPSISEVDSFTGLANYLAGWIDYSVASFVNFFAWCPDNSAALSYFGNDMLEREPFATLDEFDAVLNDVKNEMNAYDWNSVEDYSVLSKSPAQSAEMIKEYIFGPLPADSPWVEGDLVDLSTPETTTYFENCTWAFADYLGPRLGEGVCFASNWAKEVGFTFWIQLAMDVAIMFVVIRSVLDSIWQVVYLMVGVNFGTRTR